MKIASLLPCVSVPTLHLLFKGDSVTSVAIEDVSRAVTNGEMFARSSTVSEDGQVKLSSESYINEKQHWRDNVNFKAMTRDGGFPKLALLDDASTWHEGKVIIITVIIISSSIIVCHHYYYH